MLSAYYEERRIRVRKLFTSSSDFATRIAKSTRGALEPETILAIVLQAGQEALRCSGPGWFPDSDITVSPGKGKPIALKLVGFKRIEIEVNAKQCAVKLMKMPASSRTAHPFSVIENAAGALVFLFAGYFNICPWDSWRHRELVRAAVRGGYGSFWVAKEEEELAQAVAMFFERSVVAHFLTELEQATFVEGLVHERILNDHPANLLVSLFERIQSMLFPDAWANVRTSFPPIEDPVAEALLPEVLPLLFGGRVRSVRGTYRIIGRSARPDSWKWAPRVEQLAELLIPCMERQQKQSNSGSGPSPFAQGSQDGAGLGDGSSTVATAPTGDGANPFAGSGLGDSLPGSSGQEVSGGGNGGGIGPGHSAPPVYNNFEAIDKYFSEKADVLVVRDSSEKQAERKPVRIVAGFQRYEEASLADVVGERIAWSKTRLCDPDEFYPLGLRLQRYADPFEIPDKGDDPSPQGLPHLMICADSSSSMGFVFTPPNGVGGKFSVVLAAAWGIFRHIQESRAAETVKLLGLNFSNTTYSSGWQSCANLEPVKRALGMYQGGGTTLNTQVLRHAHETSSGKYLAIVITDGGLANSAEALGAFREIVRAGNHLTLLHIGSENEFTKGIRDLNCPVHLLNKAEDLVGLCLDLAKENYTVA